MRSSSASSGAWPRLLQESAEPIFHTAWLAQLAEEIDGLEELVLVLGPANSGPFAPVATWPHQTPCSGPLQALCEQVLEMRRAVAETRDGRGYLAVPVERGGDVLGVVGLGVAGAVDADARRRVTLALGWLLAHPSLHPDRGDGELSERLLLLLELLLSTHGESPATETFQAVLSEAAVRLGCDRVSMGSVRGGRIRLLALSQAANFSRRIDLTRALEAAMDEAADQGGTLQVPADGGGLATTRCHEALAAEQGNAWITTVPFTLAQGHYGAMTFEWADAPEPQTRGVAEGVAAVVGRVLLERELADLSLFGALRRSTRRQMGRLFGPRYLGRKLAVLALLGVVAFFSVATGQFRVKADAALEGTVNRTLSAPFDGFVDGAYHRAGQQVRGGAVIASLDERDLRLELLGHATQRAQFEREMRAAQASRDTAAARIAEAQMRQAAAQMEMTQMMLERTEIVAPFDAIITSGDLSQQLGRPVQRGDALFELAPVADYRVVIQVDERDIGEIAPGQRGTLVMRAFPERPVGFRVTLITPVSQPAEGSNRFRVEAQLDESLPAMRPGMAGVARVDIDERHLIAIWTREARHWLSLALWRWFGV